MKSIHIIWISTILVTAVLAQSDPSWDHQTSTYTANNKPATVLNGEFTITPYFSPDHSIGLETDLVGNATTSIDLGIPGFDSWIYCSCGAGSYKICSPAEQRYDETFPIFAALLNAAHNGVKIRILTNNYNAPCNESSIEPLTFLAVAGIEVRYYKTTTFIHSKYMMVDGKQAAISSVNFSHTSFMKNREAGVLVEGPDSGPIQEFLNSVFEADWNEALPWPTPQYSESDLEIIQNTSQLPVPVPYREHFYDVYVTDLVPVTGIMDEVTVFASPDFAWTTVFDALNETTQSLELYMYQVTSDDFCDKIIEISKSVSVFTMLVSNTIYDHNDQQAAIQCYNTLYNAGVSFFETELDTYTFSHQKYWVINKDTLFLSTGNWSPSDYPQGGEIFPPYGTNGWRNSNRDFNIKIVNPQIVSIFENVLNQDYAYGQQWEPSDK